MKKQIKVKIKWYNLFLVLSLTFVVLFFLSSTFNLLDWIVDSKKTKNKENEVIQNVTITEKEDNEETEIIKSEDNDKNNPYWKYINKKLIDVDFSKLKEENSDIVGWIKVSGTNINYPFVQTKDNDFYLNHSFDKKFNKAGWVFMDFRNNNKEFDKNTIIYAHNRKDKTMFGSLKNVLTDNWINNKNNYTINVSTEHENTLWQIFSIYHIETTNDYIQVFFKDNNEFINFTKKLINRSIYNFNTSVNENDIIITLSTCYKETEKLVVHAKLIKKETK